MSSLGLDTLNNGVKGKKLALSPSSIVLAIRSHINSKANRGGKDKYLKCHHICDHRDFFVNS